MTFFGYNRGVLSLATVTELFFFAFTLWLGSYLLARSMSSTAIRLTGLGLLGYAAALGVEILWGERLSAVVALPALLWIGATLHILPEELDYRQKLIRVWALAAAPALILTLVDAWFGLVIVASLLACTALVARQAAAARYKNRLAILAVIALFITLSAALILLPLEWLPRPWPMTLLGLDLLLLGVAIGGWDAFEQGERLHPHLLRSFVSTFYSAGALAFLVGVFDGGIPLLVSVTAFAILTQTFSDPIQTILDRWMFSHTPALSGERETLR